MRKIACHPWIAIHTDYYLLCSGVAAPIEELTKNNYDLQFGTNVLGHFHLTAFLLPALLAALEPRVINVSSIAHHCSQYSGIHFETLKGPTKGTWIPLLSLNERFSYYGQTALKSSTTNFIPILIRLPIHQRDVCCVLKH
jgi:NAD(P)-dependent dehydrogenase (short-subunit alcohol dehydrogenase family)